ncbi:unnamed protein product [Boreogadus saida]
MRLEPVRPPCPIKKHPELQLVRVLYIGSARGTHQRRRCQNGVVNREKKEVQNQRPTTRAKTIFSPPFSFDAFQEFLHEDGLIAKTHEAVETLYVFKATVWRWFSTNKKKTRRTMCIMVRSHRWRLWQKHFRDVGKF